MPGTILSPTTVHPEERVGNLKKISYGGVGWLAIKFTCSWDGEWEMWCSWDLCCLGGKNLKNIQWEISRNLCPKNWNLIGFAQTLIGTIWYFKKLVSPCWAGDQLPQGWIDILGSGSQTASLNRTSHQCHISVATVIMIFFWTQWISP